MEKGFLYFILLWVGLYAFIEWKLPLRETDFDSFDEFCEAGARGYLELPEGAENMKYYLDYPLWYMNSIYSYKNILFYVMSRKGVVV